MPEDGETPPGTLEQTLAALSRKIGEAQGGFDAAVKAQQDRSTVLARWLWVLGGGLAAAAAGLAVTLAILLGAVAELRDQGDRLDRKARAQCEQNANFAELAAQSLRVAASRSPGVRPTVPPGTGKIARDAVAAYIRAGCPEEFGPPPELPPELVSPAAPVPAPPPAPGPPPGG